MSDIKFYWRKELNTWVAMADVPALGAHLPKAGDQINVYKKDGTFQTKTVKQARAMQGSEGYVLSYLV